VVEDDGKIGKEEERTIRKVDEENKDRTSVLV